MLFNSLAFGLFFPLVVVLYFWLPVQKRWPLLLAASYYFYMCWKLEYVLLILASTLIDYVASLRIHASPSAGGRKRWLGLSLAANLGMLVGFKYLNFLSDSLEALLDFWRLPFEGLAFQVLLPVGISFYTFQTISYTIDVYRGKIEPERHFGRFAVYVSFFPQLVAGPIERAGQLLPQFLEEHRFDYARAVSGLRLMLWGFVKKVLIADNLAEYVNVVYENPGHFDGFVILTATFFFAFQVYCDFSGYADIAVGSARVLGYRLSDNFERPYLSRSMAEFWRRWHISLSTWFKDYLYLPMGGSRVARWRFYFNMATVFMVSGLWHGASWNFVVFGLLNGLYLVLGHASLPARERLAALLGLDRLPLVRRAWQTLWTFCLFSFALIFFRSTSTADALTLVARLPLLDWAPPNIGFFGREELAINFLLVAFLLWTHWLERRGPLDQLVGQLRPWTRKGVYLLAAMALLLYGNFGLKAFIYFQF